LKLATKNNNNNNNNNHNGKASGLLHCRCASITKSLLREHDLGACQKLRRTAQGHLGIGRETTRSICQRHLPKSCQLLLEVIKLELAVVNLFLHTAPQALQLGNL